MMVRPPIATEDLEHTATHAEAALRDLKGARIFLTGGTGFYGRWLLESFTHANRLFGLGAHVTVLTRSASAFLMTAPHLRSRTDIAFHEGDVRTFEDPDGEHSHVFHLATQTTSGVAALDTIDTIVIGTRRVLDFSVTTGAKRVVLASSGAIYGAQPSDVVHVEEDCVRGPRHGDVTAPYAEGKRLAEVLGEVYARENHIHVVHARGFAFAGPHLPLGEHFAIGNFVRDAHARKEIVIEGDGTPFRSYLYGADLASWLWVLLMRGVSGRAYNVGSDDGRPLREIAAIVGSVANLPVRIVGVADPIRAPARYVPSTKRAREELGLTAHIDLVSATKRWLMWLSQMR